MKLILEKKWIDRSPYERALVRGTFYLYLFVSVMVTGTWLFDIDWQTLMAGLAYIL
jgi:hypothetical protein